MWNILNNFYSFCFTPISFKKIILNGRYLCLIFYSLSLISEVILFSLLELGSVFDEEFGLVFISEVGNSFFNFLDNVLAVCFDEGWNGLLVISRYGSTWLGILAFLSL